MKGDRQNSIRPLRLVVFTCGELGLEAAVALARLEEVAHVTAITTPYWQPRRRGWQKLVRALRYDGWRATTTAVLRRLGSPFGRYTAPGVQAPSSPVPDLDVLHFGNFHEPECVAAIRHLQPDLGVVVGTYLLLPSVFEIPRLGSINLHTGKAPEYRGSAPVFWEMFNGEEEVGVTIHEVAEKLDSGTILRQEMIPIDPAPMGDVLEYIEWVKKEVLLPEGVDLLVDTVREIAWGSVEARAQDGKAARTYRMPTHREKRELYRRIRSRRGVPLRRRIKDVGAELLFRTGAFRRLVRGRAFVVLFHRVDDRYPGNPISCSRWEFDRICAFFAEFFDVITARELLDLLERGEDVTGKLVITFDDGYADNIAAARTMMKHQVPECFFLATDFIGTSRNGWWDVEQGCRSEWMTWNDVRQLQEWGFEIGAHTGNHVDLGLMTGSAAAQEIARSQEVLERELGNRVDLFAFPYGRMENLDPENRGEIRSRFRACMSAYGGFVTNSSHSQDLQRWPISPWDEAPWYISPWYAGIDLIIQPKITGADAFVASAGVVPGGAGRGEGVERGSDDGSGESHAVVPGSSGGQRRQAVK